MDNLAADFIINLNNPIEAEYELGETEHFDCSFELFAAGTVWGSIDGDISNQTDLQNALNLKADRTDLDADVELINQTINENYNDLSGQITVNHNEITSLNQLVQSYGDIVTYNATDFATASQGALADTALQSGDNITELVNNAGYITSADLPTLEDLTTQAQMNAINSGATSVNIAQIASNTQTISTETLNRQNADNGLQSQIDAIVASSDVFDIVGTYAELQAYDISTVPPNDIIKVLVDSTHNNAATYYRCIETNSVKSWSYIGSEGAYYTKSEADGRFVPQTRTINGKDLSNNILLTATDVNALPNTTVIGDGILSVQKNGTTIDTFSANATENKSINITVPTDTSDLTNNAGFITSEDLPTVNNGTLTIQVNGTSVGTFTANQSGNTTANIVVPDSATWGNITGDIDDQTDLKNALSAKYDASNPDGYISGINSTDVTTALGYTPVNPSSLAAVATSGDYDDLTNKPTIPTNYVTTDTAQNISGRKTFLGEKAIYFKQSATTDKLGFTLYNSSNTELGAFEWRPNTISGGALLNVNVPYSSSNYVGFRYWGTAVNIIAPKVATAGNYYIPTHITDGNTTVTASSNGTVNISSLLPNVSGYLENTATGSNSLSIFGSDATYNDAINIGYNSNAIGSHSVTIGCESYDAYYPEAGNFSVAIGNGAIAETNSVAVGYEAQCYYNTNNSIAIGNQASVSKSGNNTTTYAIQLGEGENTTSNTMQVWNYPLLDKTTGLIPDARLSSNIARTSQIPTVPTNISAFTNDSGYVTSSALNGYVQNTATGSNSLTIEGYTTSANNATNVGAASRATRAQATAFGKNAEATAQSSTALGGYSVASADYSIQIGYGTNSNASTLSIGFANGGGASAVNFQLLDGITGLIPDARLSSNIARTANVADTTLSNVSSIDSNSAVKTALDTKLNTADVWYDSTTSTLNIGVAQV